GILLGLVLWPVNHPNELKSRSPEIQEIFCLGRRRWGYQFDADYLRYLREWLAVEHNLPGDSFAGVKLTQVLAWLQGIERNGASCVPREGANTQHRPCYDRDHLWLSWADAKMGPAAIRDKWNEEHPKEKIGSGESGREVVKTALKKARAERPPD